MQSPGARALLRGEFAAAPRTLLDILRSTAEDNPQSSALTDSDGSLSYRELLRAVNASAARLVVAGVRRGDRVGIRIPSGGRVLYISILAVMLAGASYVPVDADDPEERAEMVFGEADVVGIVGADGMLAPRGTVLATRDDPEDTPTLGTPTGSITPIDPVLPTDDAWVIFTS